MTREMLTGNLAAAWGARLAKVDYVPAFPITPQTEIIETLAHWFDDGTLPGKFVSLDSEHSMLTAAGAAAATGVRVFTATSSQGLLYAFEASRPMAQGVAVLGGALYSFFKYQTHLAAQNALVVHEEVAQRFADAFGRRYGLVEAYRMDDPDYVLVMSNAFATKGKAAVNRFRAQGVPVGLLRLRVLRPFPAQTLAAALRGRKAVAVMDQNLSVGFGGITYAEIASALYAAHDRPLLLSYVGGLGGKDLSDVEFDHILEDLQRSVADGQAMPPRLLYTDREEGQLATFLQIAGKGETA
jgi:pyruvate/2-oxoacid:ferredoxin oxidoreductase alpha subunit